MYEVDISYAGITPVPVEMQILPLNKLWIKKTDDLKTPISDLSEIYLFVMN